LQLSLFALLFLLAIATAGRLCFSSNFPKEIFVQKRLPNSFDLFEVCPTGAVEMPGGMFRCAVTYLLAHFGSDRSCYFGVGIAALPLAFAFANALALADQTCIFPLGCSFLPAHPTKAGRASR
jgi:hypothetical protein